MTNGAPLRQRELPLARRSRAAATWARRVDDPGNGKAGQAIPDEEVLEFATAQGRVVLTLNRKYFLRLARVRPHHGGLIVCTFDSDFAGQAARIHQALSHEPSIVGRVLRVNRPS